MSNGIQYRPTSVKDDAPTNVKFQETSSVTDGHFISVIVMADDSLSIV